MSFDWKKAAEGGSNGNGYDRPERIPTGYHWVSIAKVMSGKSDGTPFKTKAGDPKILIVFNSEDGCEAAQFYALSDKAGWVLAKLLARLGFDLDELHEEQIEPRDWANDSINKRLLDAHTWVHVSYSPGRDGKEYADIEPQYSHELPHEIDQAVPSHNATATNASVKDIPDVEVKNGDESIPF